MTVDWMEDDINPVIDMSQLKGKFFFPSFFPACWWDDGAVWLLLIGSSLCELSLQNQQWTRWDDEMTEMNNFPFSFFFSSRGFDESVHERVWLQSANAVVASRHSLPDEIWTVLGAIDCHCHSWVNISRGPGANTLNEIEWRIQKYAIQSGWKPL